LGNNSELMERAEKLSERERYRLIELLDPGAVTHYEFFLGRPPLVKADWALDEAILAAIPERNPCIDGWPSKCLFNYDYQIINLSEPEFEFIKACDENGQSVQRTVREILANMEFGLEKVRSLLNQQLIMLTPG
ncbi:MAG: SAM-dependent methyltransferase, partial [Coleofasciculaceae cyanobacterium]